MGAGSKNFGCGHDAKETSTDDVEEEARYVLLPKFIVAVWPFNTWTYSTND
jgi:hypothetical protein